MFRLLGKNDQKFKSPTYIIELKNRYDKIEEEKEKIRRKRKMKNKETDNKKREHGVFFALIMFLFIF